MKPLWITPAPSSGFLSGVSFEVLKGRSCKLAFRYEDRNGRLTSCVLRFLGVEAFKCTYLTSLSVEMIESAYDRLIEVRESPWLEEALIAARHRGDSPSLKHLRICFDDGPCYEFICAEFEETLG